MKYEYLIFFLGVENENELKAVISNSYHTINKICKEYKKIYFANVHSLKFFSNKNEINKKVFYDFNLGDHVKFISFSSYLKFMNFLRKKKIVGISFGFGTAYSDLLLNIIMGIYDIKHVQIQNVGNDQVLATATTNIFKRFLYFYLRDRLSRKLTSILSFFGITQKIEIRFVSNSKTIVYRNNNSFKNLRSKLNLFQVKEFILINSRSYDILKENLLEIDQKYIVLLDEQLNEKQFLRFRRAYSEEEISKHYLNLNQSLKKLSHDLKKEVIITLHPYDDIDYKKKIFKDFKVVKFRTREFIYKSFLILFFESSAITDALLLNKNMALIKSKFLDKNLIDAQSMYENNFNLSYLDIDEPFEKTFNKENLSQLGILKSKEQLKKDYKQYLEDFVSRASDNTEGYKKIISEINKRYF